VPTSEALCSVKICVINQAISVLSYVGVFFFSELLLAMPWIWHADRQRLPDGGLATLCLVGQPSLTKGTCDSSTSDRDCSFAVFSPQKSAIGPIGRHRMTTYNSVAVLSVIVSYS